MSNVLFSLGTLLGFGPAWLLFLMSPCHLSEDGAVG